MSEAAAAVQTQAISKVKTAPPHEPAVDVAAAKIRADQARKAETRARAKTIYGVLQDRPFGLSEWSASILAAHMMQIVRDADKMTKPEVEQWGRAFMTTHPFLWPNVRNGDLTGFLAKLRIQGDLPRLDLEKTEEDRNTMAAMQAAQYGELAAAIRG
jgi:hypothetical protein